MSVRRLLRFWEVVFSETGSRGLTEGTGQSDLGHVRWTRGLSGRLHAVELARVCLLQLQELALAVTCEYLGSLLQCIHAIEAGGLPVRWQEYIANALRK
jgi:hypothetical protein